MAKTLPLNAFNNPYTPAVWPREIIGHTETGAPVTIRKFRCSEGAGTYVQYPEYKNPGVKDLPALRDQSYHKAKMLPPVFVVAIGGERIDSFLDKRRAISLAKQLTA